MDRDGSNFKSGRAAWPFCARSRCLDELYKKSFQLLLVWFVVEQGAVTLGEDA
jgi:hypothetical protein